MFLPLSEKAVSDIQDKIDRLTDDACKYMILYAATLMHDEELKELLQRLSATVQVKMNNSADVSTTALQEVLSSVKQALNWVKASPHVINKLPFVDLLRRAERLDELLPSMNLSSHTANTFVFIESELMEAVRNGHWVLLDNVNSAPPEVMERLNSLTEERPVLNVYEHADGEELTREKGIHPDFRIFSSANIQRIYTNKLSSAYVNRVIRIWLPTMDDDLRFDAVENSDLFDLLKHQLGGVSAGAQLAAVVLKVHAWMKERVLKREMALVANSTLTYRNIAQTIDTFLYLLNECKMGPVQAMTWSLVRCYSYCIAQRSQRVPLFTTIADALHQADAGKRSQDAYPRLPVVKEDVPQWQRDAGDIGTAVSLLEEVVPKAIVVALDSDGTAHVQEAADAAVSLMGGLLPLMHPTLKQQVRVCSFMPECRSLIS